MEFDKTDGMDPFTVLDILAQMEYNGDLDSAFKSALFTELITATQSNPIAAIREMKYWLATRP